MVLPSSAVVEANLAISTESAVAVSITILASLPAVKVAVICAAGSSWGLDWGSAQSLKSSLHAVNPSVIRNIPAYINCFLMMNLSF